MMNLLLCALLMAGVPDWNQWRGAHRNGTTQLPLAEAWPQELKRGWRVEVGKGYGSPVVQGKRVFLLTSEGTQDRVLCLDRDSGQTLWQHRYPIAFKPNPYATRYGAGPFATPLVYRNQLVTVGITGVISCFNTKGNLLWQKASIGDLADERVLFCGNSGSPLLLDNRYLVHVGNEHKGSLLALNSGDGSTAWSWDGDLPGYASPAIVELDGVHQIVTPTQNMVVGLSTSGKLLWSHPFKVEWRENIVDPIVFGNTVVVSGREQRATTALQVKRDGENWTVKTLWSNPQQFMYISSPIKLGDEIWGLAHQNKGSFFRINANTGALIEMGDGRQGTSATFVCSEKTVLALTDGGKLLVFDRNQGIEQQRTYKLAESETWAFPVPVDNGLLVKDDTSLTFWQY